jgi:hypothetical protein
MAREFRDRYLDEVYSGRCLPGGWAAWGACKYDVSRQLEVGGPPSAMKVVPLLDAA